MKKHILTLMCVYSACGLCSCNSVTNDSGTISEISAESLVGSSEEIPYEEVMNMEMFSYSYESYTDTANPLQLKGGTYEDAAVAKPFKSVIVDESGVIAPLNIWQFPVVHDESFIGFIKCDVRYPEMGEPSFYGGESYAPILNDALQKGDIAIFNTTVGIYGIYEDNTVITLEANEDYNGTLTFNDINKEYNLITSDSSSNIVYTSDK